ncbi:hypothetical protein BGZ94_004847 [Podila epigama]|nr:hypothetical protein BGZ94_004847 [Podila epigama]
MTSVSTPHITRLTRRPHRGTEQPQPTPRLSPYSSPVSISSKHPTYSQYPPCPQPTNYHYDDQQQHHHHRYHHQYSHHTYNHQSNNNNNSTIIAAHPPSLQDHLAPEHLSAHTIRPSSNAHPILQKYKGQFESSDFLASILNAQAKEDELKAQAAQGACEKERLMNKMMKLQWELQQRRWAHSMSFTAQESSTTIPKGKFTDTNLDTIKECTPTTDALPGLPSPSDCQASMESETHIQEDHGQKASDPTSDSSMGPPASAPDASQREYQLSWFRPLGGSLSPRKNALKRKSTHQNAVINATRVKVMRNPGSFSHPKSTQQQQQQQQQRYQQQEDSTASSHRMQGSEAGLQNSRHNAHATTSSSPSEPHPAASSSVNTTAAATAAATTTTATTTTTTRMSSAGQVTSTGVSVTHNTALISKPTPPRMSYHARLAEVKARSSRGSPLKIVINAESIQESSDAESSGASSPPPALTHSPLSATPSSSSSTSSSPTLSQRESERAEYKTGSSAILPNDDDISSFCL